MYSQPVGITNTSYGLLHLAPFLSSPFTSCSDGLNYQLCRSSCPSMNCCKEREKRVCVSALAWLSLRLNCQTLLCKHIEKWQIVTHWPFLQSNIAINHPSLGSELGSERVKGQHKVLYLGPLCAAACMFSLGQQNNLARTTKCIIREWNLWCSAIKFKTIWPLFHFLYFLSRLPYISA